MRESSLGFFSFFLLFSSKTEFRTVFCVLCKSKTTTKQMIKHWNVLKHESYATCHSINTDAIKHDSFIWCAGEWAELIRCTCVIKNKVFFGQILVILRRLYQFFIVCIISWPVPQEFVSVTHVISSFLQEQSPLCFAHTVGIMIIAYNNSHTVDSCVFIQYFRIQLVLLNTKKKCLWPNSSGALLTTIIGKKCTMVK